MTNKSVMTFFYVVSIKYLSVCLLHVYHIKVYDNLIILFYFQASAPAKSIFNISCVLILLCVPCRMLGIAGAEMILLSLAAPCAWSFLLFFARQVPVITSWYIAATRCGSRFLLTGGGGLRSTLGGSGDILQPQPRSGGSKGEAG